MTRATLADVLQISDALALWADISKDGAAGTASIAPAGTSALADVVTATVIY